jgi:hypothetical protein
MPAARMSVILVTDRFRTIRRVFARLREQTVKDQLEIVIVIPSGSREGDDTLSFEDFASFQIVEIPTVHPMPVARASGIRAATAPIVFLGETHSFPGPAFAEKLIAAHSGDWDVVVPGFSNANPESALSWEAFLSDYGMWNETLPSGQVGGGPTWNVAYKRSVLGEVDDRLERAMEHGDELALWFRARGGRAYFEPAARIEHANVSKGSSWIEQRFLCGLLVANARKQRWSVGKRLLYVVASPLIPAVIMYRLRKPLKNLMSNGTLPLAALGAMLVGTIVRTAGEVVGYTVGASPEAQPRMDEFELHKLAFTSLEM